MTGPRRPSVAERAGRWSPGSRVAVAVLRGIVFLLLAAFIGLLLLVRSTGAAENDAREAAAAAAAMKVPQVLSYDHRTVEQDLARAEAATTGPFRQQLADLGRSTIAPAARAQGLTSTATVVGTAVVSVDGQQVVLLMFVNQSTTSAEAPEPRVTANRSRVTMTSVDGQWLISNLQVL